MARRPRPHTIAAALGLVVALMGGLCAVVLRPRPLISYTPSDPPVVQDIFEFQDSRQQQSQRAGVSDEQSERLVLHRTRGSEVVFLYVHGFSASRGEGELVVDTLAAEWSANVWYLRLPGHGGPGRALGEASAPDYFDTVTEALGMARSLGDKVILVGTSTGATLGIWAAATYPDLVDGLIIASPLIEYVDPRARFLMESTYAAWLAERMLGETRDVWSRATHDPRRGPQYRRHWIGVYPTKALVELDDVRRYATQSAILEAVRQPTLLLYHFRDESDQDTVVDVAAAREAFTRFNGGTPHPHSRSVAVADGAHVLLSEHVETDKATVLRAMRNFLRDVAGPPPRERALRQTGAPLGQPPG